MTYTLPAEYPYKDRGTAGAQALTADDYNAVLAAVADLSASGGRVPDLEDAVDALETTSGPTFADRSARPLHELTLLQMRQYFTWARLNSASTFIGEVGWPYPSATEGPRWNDLGAAMYAYLDRKAVSACYWGARKSGYDDPVTTYIASGGLSGTLDTSKGQGAVIERHAPTATLHRGIVLADGHRGFTETASTGTGSDVNTGTFGTTYSYGAAADYLYLAAKGYDTVRLPFRWERVQPTLNAALNTTEVGRLTTAISYAAAAGMKVILVPKNTGSYYQDVTGTSTRRDIGGAQVPISAFVDFWTRMSAAFKTNTDVLAYDLMNEPAMITAATWQSASQQALTAIRNNSDTKLILVEGAVYSSLTNWVQDNGPTGWITDPSSNFAYSPHLYPGRIAYDRALDSYADEAETVMRALAAAPAQHGRSQSQVDTCPVTASSGAITSGRTYISYFTSPLDVTVDTIEAWTGGTASASLTATRMSLAISSADDLTIVAETASDTTLFNSTFAAHARTFSTARSGPASYRLVAGQRYALLVLVVGSTMPVLAKNTLVAGAMAARTPRLCMRLDSQTDIVAPGTAITAASMTNPADQLFITVKGTGDTVSY